MVVYDHGEIRESYYCEIETDKEENVGIELILDTSE